MYIYIYIHSKKATRYTCFITSTHANTYRYTNTYETCMHVPTCSHSSLSMVPLPSESISRTMDKISWHAKCKKTNGRYSHDSTCTACLAIA